VSRWAWAEVDLGVIKNNIETMLAAAAVWASVKADGYGLGVRRRAALEGGATGNAWP
jgi:alanine racemase